MEMEWYGASSSNNPRYCFLSKCQETCPLTLWPEPILCSRKVALAGRCFNHLSSETTAGCSRIAVSMHHPCANAWLAFERKKWCQQKELIDFMSLIQYIQRTLALLKELLAVDQPELDMCWWAFRIAPVLGDGARYCGLLWTTVVSSAMLPKLFRLGVMPCFSISEKTSSALQGRDQKELHATY